MKFEEEVEIDEDLDATQKASGENKKLTRLPNTLGPRRIAKLRNYENKTSNTFVMEIFHLEYFQAQQKEFSDSIQQVLLR